MLEVPGVPRVPTCVALAAALAFAASRAGAQDAATAGQPAGSQPPSPVPALGEQDRELDSLEQGTTALADSFDVGALVREQRRAALEATEYDVHLRSYYLDRNRFDGSESEAWAIGGWAGLKTGYFRDLVAIGGTGFFSLPLYAPEDKDGTLLLQEGQQGYAVLGELYGEIKLSEHVVADLGRKAYDTPYVNRYDIRMTPNTFEAYTVSGLHGGEGGAPQWRWGAGYFDEIKPLNSEDFVSMSQHAGADVERGVYAAGANYRRGDFSFGAIDYHSEDVLNIAYTEAKYALPLSEELRLQLAAQYSHQQSTGDDLLTGSDFSGYQCGLKGELGYGAALVTAAWTRTGTGAALQSPWGGYPGYTSVQLQDFNRAGEEAFMLRLAWKFPRVPGLSAYGLWVSGSDPAGAGEYPQDEYDLNLQWSTPKGAFEGLTFRFRYAVVERHGSGEPDMTDLRFIVYYDPPGL